MAGGGGVLLPLPPQPESVPIKQQRTSAEASDETSARKRRRLAAGMSSRKAKARIGAPALSAMRLNLRSSAALVAAVEFMVSVAVCAALLVMLTEDEESEQVTGSTAEAGAVVTEHARLTAPVKPPDGVAVMVAVFPLAAPGAMVSGPLLESAKAPAPAPPPPVTVTVDVVEAVMAPVAASLAVTVMM